MRRPNRALHVAVLGTLLIGLAFPLPVSATNKTYTTYYDAGGRPFLSIGLYGGYAHFNIRYQVGHTQDAGRTWWSVTKLETVGIASQGQNCVNSGYCLNFSMAVKVEFLNAAGSVLLTAYPPYGSCYTNYTNSYDRFVFKCSPSGYQVSLSANRIRFTFTMSVVRKDGWVFSWPTVKKTVPIG